MTTRMRVSARRSPSRQATRWPDGASGVPNVGSSPVQGSWVFRYTQAAVRVVSGGVVAVIPLGSRSTIAAS